MTNRTFIQWNYNNEIPMIKEALANARANKKASHDGVALDQCIWALEMATREIQKLKKQVALLTEVCLTTKK